jgi:hypothetical protein
MRYIIVFNSRGQILKTFLLLVTFFLSEGYNHTTQCIYVDVARCLD